MRKNVIAAAVVLAAFAVGSEATQAAQVTETGPQEVTVTQVSEGDTIEVAIGGAPETVRLVGIDAPETGSCESAAAAIRLQELIGGHDVTLVPAPGGDRDQYGRLLRYVQVSATDAQDIDGYVDGVLDVGAALIGGGYAIARYDSRDGYGRHDREDAYVALDEASPAFVCSTQQVDAFFAALAPTTVAPATSTTQATPAPVAAPQQQNVYYQNCDAVRAAGAAPIHSGDPGWQQKFDRDHDGVGCE